MSLPVSLVLGLLAGLAATPAWGLVLRVIYATPFGIRDPIFSRDIGYYVFTLPGLSAALGFLSALVVISLLLLVPIYGLRGDIVLGPRRLTHRAVGGHASGHPAGGVLPAHRAPALAGGYPRACSIRPPARWSAPATPICTLGCPALRVSAVLAVLAAAAVLIGGIRRQLARYGLWAIGGYLVVAFLGRGLFRSVMQKFVVAPTELTRETPYLRHHIAATRQAWGIDSVEIRELEGEADLTLADIQANAADHRERAAVGPGSAAADLRPAPGDPHLLRLRLGGRRPLLDRRAVPPGAALAARAEPGVAAHPDLHQRAPDLHPRDGAHAGPGEPGDRRRPAGAVHQGPAAGLDRVAQGHPAPDLLRRAHGLLRVRGHRAARVRPSLGRGQRLPAVRGQRRRAGRQSSAAAVLAAHFGSLKILLSSDITSESRVLYYREHRRTRAQQALPFLLFDRDPYIVIATTGRLKWILDAYTTSDGYPYAQRLGNGTNYMRNSVKLVIDAYDGVAHRVCERAGRSADPHLAPGSSPASSSRWTACRRTCGRTSAIPMTCTGSRPDLYTTYHMEAPEDFYHREDQWQIPVVRGGARRAVPFMRHIVMRLPEEPKAEFIYMVPFTPRGKDNLAAWMVARNDGEQYGKLRVYRLSRQSLVFGPQQIVNRINQDTEISRQVSLWDQRGSQVIRGDLLVIPIEESLLYVQPLYLRAEGGRIPELKRVVVAYQNQVVMEETLDAGLARAVRRVGGGKE